LNYPKKVRQISIFTYSPLRWERIEETGYLKEKKGYFSTKLKYTHLNMFVH